MILTDIEIRDKFIEIINIIYNEKRISLDEAESLIFYGLYKNKWFQNAGMKHPNDIETWFKTMYPDSQFHIKDKSEQ